MNALTIGQVARSSGTGIETIRFYEREGLIERPSRSQSGYRQYVPEVVPRLHFIRQAKELGFSLKEIKELLALKLDPVTRCADVMRQCEAKVADIDRKIATLRRMKRVLVKLASACPGDEPVSACPILEALECKEIR